MYRVLRIPIFLFEIERPGDVIFHETDMPIESNGGGIFIERKSKGMASLGSKQRPVIVKVTSEKMAKKVAQLCKEHDLVFIAGFEDEEDLTDLKIALKEKSAPKDIYDPCPCGSGSKYKFCCMKKEFILNI